MTTVAPPPAPAAAGPSDYLSRGADFIRPNFSQVNLNLEGYLKTEKGFKLDSDDSICRLSLLPPGCPLGPTMCPLRHTTPSGANFQPSPASLLPTNPRERERKTTVCRHYLRNLCKLGPNCDFSHDFNLRTMPECTFFRLRGKCELGGECLYLHRTKDEMRVECPDYNRGFCVLGPECPRRHIRRVLCQSYAAGFCPDGPDCKHAHPSPKKPPRESYVNPTPADPALAGPPPSLPAGYGRWREYKYDENALVRPTAAWLEGGSLSGWRAGGVMSGTGGGGGGGGGGRDREPDYGDRGDRGDRGSGPSDRGGGAGGGGGGRQGGWVKDLSSVLCFYGHFANTCPNQAIPGDRGGLRQQKR